MTTSTTTEATPWWELSLVDRWVTYPMSTKKWHQLVSLLLSPTSSQPILDCWRNRNIVRWCFVFSQSLLSLTWLTTSTHQLVRTKHQMTRKLMPRTRTKNLVEGLAVVAPNKFETGTVKQLQKILRTKVKKIDFVHPLRCWCPFIHIWFSFHTARTCCDGRNAGSFNHFIAQQISFHVCVSSAWLRSRSILPSFHHLQNHQKTVHHIDRISTAACPTSSEASFAQQTIWKALEFLKQANPLHHPSMAIRDATRRLDLRKVSGWWTFLWVPIPTSSFPREPPHAKACSQSPSHQNSNLSLQRLHTKNTNELCPKQISFWFLSTFHLSTIRWPSQSNQRNHKSDQHLWTHVFANLCSSRNLHGRSTNVQRCSLSTQEEAWQIALSTTSWIDDPSVEPTRSPDSLIPLLPPQSPKIRKTWSAFKIDRLAFGAKSVPFARLPSFP